MKILVLVYTILLIILAAFYLQNSRTIKELTAALSFEQASCEVELKKERAVMLDTLRREEATILDNCRGK